MLKSRASRTRAAIVAVLVSLGVWACATMRSDNGGGGNGGNGGGGGQQAATVPATRIAATTTSSSATALIGAPLTITVKDLRSKKGSLIFGVFKSADGFPNIEAKSVY